jgi:hypothetical protein
MSVDRTWAPRHLQTSAIGWRSRWARKGPGGRWARPVASAAQPVLPQIRERETDARKKRRRAEAPANPPSLVPKEKASDALPARR